jgi:PAS domain S-box-containing protein
VDDNQRIELFNPAAERMFGRSAAEEGQPTMRCSRRLQHAEHIRRFARTGVSSRQLVGPGCVRGRRANGEAFEVEASISQIKVQGRRLFTVILRDISRRIRDEQALRESEERVALFAATTFEGIVISERGRILDCNEQFARMTGYTVQELAGRLIEELVVPEDRERVTSNIRRGRESIVEHAMPRDGGASSSKPTARRSGRLYCWFRSRPCATSLTRQMSGARERTERYELPWPAQRPSGTGMCQAGAFTFPRNGRRQGFADDEVGDGEEALRHSSQDAARHGGSPGPPPKTPVLPRIPHPLQGRVAGDCRPWHCPARRQRARNPYGRLESDITEPSESSRRCATAGQTQSRPVGGPPAAGD